MAAQSNPLSLASRDRRRWKDSSSCYDAKAGL